MPTIRNQCVTYAGALLLGLAYVFWLFPLDQFLPPFPLAAAWNGDAVQHVTGQRYFIYDAWHWPLLVFSKSMNPEPQSWSVRLGLS